MNSLPAVFLIDDDVAIQGTFRDLLGTWGIRVHSFFSAEAFLEVYSGDWTGCLIIDVRMEGISGFDLLRELRCRGSPMPAILMSGHGDASWEQEAIQAGAFAFLEKPFRVEQLKEYLARHCPELFLQSNKLNT
jgi:two-component system, LuxR family, response regulator DctR